MALQSAQAEQQLLYSLRSPTTPLSDKLNQASSALHASPSSTSLPPLVRDWALETLLKATRVVTADSPVLDGALWAVVARTTEATPSASTSTPTLPIFVSFVGAYADSQADVEILRSALATWRRLAPGGMRKATADAALDGYEKLVEATVKVLQRDGEANETAWKAWEEFAMVWLKALRGIVLDGGKGGKKVPQHTLALLPKLLPLLSLLPPASHLRLTLLQTVQLAVFNLENLKRGLARETYTAVSSQGAAATADIELLAALSPLLSTLSAPIYAVLPPLTSLYFSALATHSAVLFPLPAKANFPTPSAQKSALEVLGLTKRRELAGRWVKGVAALVKWSKAEEEMEADVSSSAEGAAAVAAVLAEVEKEDLYRSGQAGEGWEGVLSSVVRGAVQRMQESSPAPGDQEAVFEVLSVVGRLSYEAVEPELPAVLSVLARTPSTSTTSSPAVDLFLSQLVTHHSRSVSLPTLLSLLSDALASTSSLPAPTRPANNLLTTPSFLDKLGHALSGAVGGPNAVRATYEALLAPVRETVQPASATTETPADADEAAPSPAKKRKLSSSSAPPSTILAASSRLRILAVFVSSAPSSALPALLEAFKSFNDDLVEPRLRDFTKASTSSGSMATDGVNSDVGTSSKKDKKERRKSGLLPSSGAGGEVDPAVRLGVELLEVRYAALDRLNREGLLEEKEEEEVEKWWVLKGKRREALREVIGKGVGEAAIVAASTLLQQIELAATSTDEAQAVLKATLDRVAAGTDDARWSSFVREVKEQEVPVALWELVSRRGLLVAEGVAAEAQLKQVVDIVLRALARPAPLNELSVAGATCRLLRRADFWELNRVQAHFQPALLALVTLPSLSSPTPLLASDIDSKTLNSLRSLSLSTLTGTASLFSAIAATVPLEYLSKASREQLAERALALDVWISSTEVQLAEEEKECIQRELRSFVDLLAISSTTLSTVLPAIFKTTLPAAKEATLELYRSVIQTALANLKADQSPATLVGFVQSFGEKPVSDLSKRFKKGGNFTVATEASAFFLLLETLATALPTLDSVPPALLEALVGPAKNAFKAGEKAIPLATSAVQEDKSAFFQLADLLDLTRSSWVAKQWLLNGSSEVDSYISFAEAARAASFAQVPSFPSQPEAASSALALLRLLAHRIQCLHRAPESIKVASEPFEEFAACHLAFRRTLPAEARDALNANLVRCVSSVSLVEYGVVLDGLAVAVGAAASVEAAPSTLQELGQVLDVALVLLRDGPEGSSRTAGSSLSEIIRHLSLLVERVFEQTVQGELAVKVYSVAANFLDGICGERPMLLSRLDISNVLSLVARLLQPSTATPSSSSPSLAAIGELYRNLVTIVTHLVRHRKDHIIPLFPLLVSTLSGFIAILRRAGYGTTGSASSMDEVLDSSVVFGQRAEREAKATFPAWVWEGGSQAIGRPEAKALGRLLGELTSKTSAPTAKRKKEASSGGAAEEGAPTTTSLIAPLSKHAPFLLLTYLRASVHVTCPIPAALRTELQGGWFEVMDSMGRWEKEALMKGFLSEEEEAERGMLRTLFKAWEKERYRGRLPCPTGCSTTEGCFPGQDQVNPLKDLDFDNWWYRGPLYRSALPDVKDVAVLPAGGKWSAEMACHKDYTSYGDKTTKSGSEQECCPGSPGLYHSHDDNDKLDESQLGGCALGISDVTDPNKASMDGDNPIVIFSVQSKCVWTRVTEFSIPQNMPACSGEYCICSWHWIARQDLPNNYMTGFLCKIEGASSTAKWDEPKDATWCGDDSSTCVTGAKRPLYAYNTPNNVPFWDPTNPNAKRPGYNADCGFADGPQDDIFSAGSSTNNVSGEAVSALTKVAQNIASTDSAGREASEETTATAPSTASPPSSSKSTPTSSASSSSSSADISIPTKYWVIGGIALLVVAVLAVAICLGRRKKQEKEHLEEKQVLRLGRRSLHRHRRRRSISSSSSDTDSE